MQTFLFFGRVFSELEQIRDLLIVNGKNKDAMTKKWNVVRVNF